MDAIQAATLAKNYVKSLAEKDTSYQMEIWGIVKAVSNGRHFDCGYITMGVESPYPNIGWFAYNDNRKGHRNEFAHDMNAAYALQTVMEGMF